MMTIKIIECIICSVLFWWGGYSWHNARRFIMPLILALSCAWFVHTWWALTMLTSCITFTFGYGEKSLLRHIFGNGWGRGVWGLGAAICFSLGLFLTGHILWFLFFPYLVLNFILENALKDIPQFIGDPIIGIGLSSIIFIIN